MPAENEKRSGERKQSRDGNQHEDQKQSRGRQQSGGSVDTGTNRGCYVYGIVPGDVEEVPDAKGVGDPPGAVKVVRHGSIAALVSEIDTSKPLGRPEDLTAHQQILDATASEVPLLPLRFGAVMTNTKAVVDELLAPHEEEFANALGELEGRAEYVVKGRYVEKAVLAEILDENEEAARLREEIQEAGDQDATRGQRIRLGEIVNQAVSAKREEDTRKLGDAVAPYVVASNVREPSHELDAAYVAFLADTAKQKELEKAVGGLAHDWQDRIELDLLGPMASYDFVVAKAPGS
jgi:hypothetical protein